jgi:capsular polysaccharide biosynthesis protein
MELRDIIKKFKKHRQTLILSVIAGSVVGMLFSLIPAKYISSGSLYIKRSVEPSNVFFTYEGYYAQQAAQSYTNSLVALIESQDVKKVTLENMGVTATDKNLRKLDKAVKVKKSGPQVVTVSVRDQNFEHSQKLWLTLTQSVIEASKRLNENGDKNISVDTISNAPIIKETYRSLPIFSLAGVMFGLSAGLLIISLKEYLKE